MIPTPLRPEPLTFNGNVINITTLKGNSLKDTNGNSKKLTGYSDIYYVTETLFKHMECVLELTKLLLSHIF